MASTPTRSRATSGTARDGSWSSGGGKSSMARRWLSARAVATSSPGFGCVSTPLITNCWLAIPCSRSSICGRGGDRQCAAVGTCHEHERGSRRVGERLDRSGVQRSIVPQPGPWTEAAGGVGVRGEIRAPCRWQAQQSQGVSGRRGIEHDVLVATEQGRIGEQAGEGVERRDLDGAGASELFLERRDLPAREQAAVRADDTGPVVVGRLLRVEIHDVEPGDERHRDRLLTRRDLEHVRQVRRRVGRDQQDTPTAVSERDRHTGRHRGLPNPTLAREQHEAGCHARPVGALDVPHRPCAHVRDASCRRRSGAATDIRARSSTAGAGHMAADVTTSPSMPTRECATWRVGSGELRTADKPARVLVCCRAVLASLWRTDRGVYTDMLRRASRPLQSHRSPKARSSGGSASFPPADRSKVADHRHPVHDRPARRCLLIGSLRQHQTSISVQRMVLRSARRSRMSTAVQSARILL